MPIQDAPLSNKMHAVPQNFMDVEFKLIGDLTMRQFTYLMIGGVTAYVIYSTVGGVFKWPLVLFFVILGLSFAFVPIQERGLDVWLVNLFKAIYSPTLRVWKKVPIIPSALLYENLAVVKQELITLAPTSSRRKLEEYLQYQLRKDTYDPLDIPEKAYILKVKNSFADMVSDTDTLAPVGNTIGVSVLEPEPIFPNVPLIPEQPIEPEKPSENAISNVVAQSSVVVQPSVTSSPNVVSQPSVVAQPILTSQQSVVAQPNVSTPAPMLQNSANISDLSNKPSQSNQQASTQDNIDKPVKKPFFELPKIDIVKKPEDIKQPSIEPKKEVEPLFNVKPVSDILRELGRTSSQTQNTDKQPQISSQPAVASQPTVVPQPIVAPQSNVASQPTVAPQAQIKPVTLVTSPPVTTPPRDPIQSQKEMEQAKVVPPTPVAPQPMVSAQPKVAQSTPVAPQPVVSVPPKVAPQPMVSVQPKVVQPTPQENLNQKFNKPESTAPVKHSLFKRYPKHQENPEEEPQLSIMTPDMHSGRRFTNLLPSKGELVLPIRGERVLKTTEELNVEESMREKAEKLQLMMNQLKNSQAVPKAKVIDTSVKPVSPSLNIPVAQPVTMQTPVVQTSVPDKPVETPKPQKKVEENSESLDQAAQKIIEQLKLENEKLNNDIKKLQTDLDTKTEDSEKNVKEEMLKKLEAQHRKNSSDYSSLIRQIHELRSKLVQKPTDETNVSQEPVSQSPRFSNIQPLSNTPNVVTGIVKDDTGKDREGVLLIIKNDRGEPVRAIKTNALGQFVLSTPLQKGLYTVEVNSSNIEGQTFDIISVEVNGEVIPPLEIIGKKK